jgi:hypothetical protein
VQTRNFPTFPDVQCASGSVAELWRKQPFRHREAANGAACHPTNAGKEQAEKLARISVISSATHAREENSDKIGHSSCVILRESRKLDRRGLQKPRGAPPRAGYDRHTRTALVCAYARDILPPRALPKRKISGNALVPYL